MAKRAGGPKAPAQGGGADPDDDQTGDWFHTCPIFLYIACCLIYINLSRPINVCDTVAITFKKQFVRRIESECVQTNVSIFANKTPHLRSF